MIPNTFGADDAVLPTYFPAVLYRTLRDMGLGEEALLEGTGLDERAFLEDETRITFLQHRRFLRNALALTGDHHLGLRFGQKLNVTALGILGYAAMSCHDLSDALITITRYFRIRAPLLSLTLKEEGEEALLEIDEALDFGDVRYFMLSSTIAGISRILDYYAEQPEVVTRAELSCRAPRDWDRVSGELTFPVDFDQPANRIYFPRSVLGKELAMADPQTAQSTKTICEQLLARIGEQAGLVSRVRAFILQQNGGFPSLEAAADHFCVSSRTLRRELQTAGTTYQKVLDDVRSNIAMQYLKTTRKPVYDIALELGFNDPSNFGRAFRRWTGRSPNSFRGTNSAGT